MVRIKHSSPPPLAAAAAAVGQRTRAHAFSRPTPSIIVSPETLRVNPITKYNTAPEPREIFGTNDDRYLLRVPHQPPRSVPGPLPLLQPPLRGLRQVPRQAVAAPRGAPGVARPTRPPQAFPPPLPQPPQHRVLAQVSRQAVAAPRGPSRPLRAAPRPPQGVIPAVPIVVFRAARPPRPTQCGIPEVPIVAFPPPPPGQG